MASSKSTVEHILAQMQGAGAVSAKPMFGEYGIYCDGKLVALVCDDQLFVKQTPEGKLFLGRYSEGAPYPGAKPCFVIPNAQWQAQVPSSAVDENASHEWLTELICITAAHLPTPKAKIKVERKAEGKRG
jgi:TfoX/Sxy family transcriptional regulator of competence genes